MASSCVPGSGQGGQDWDGRSSKSLFKQFIANLPLKLVYGMHD